MQSSLLFVLYTIPVTLCISVTLPPTDNATISAHPSIRRVRAPGSSSRSALINYRFNKPPKRKNLDPKELMLILGTDFKPQFMSINKPPELGETYMLEEDSWRLNEILDDLHSRNFSQELQQFVEDGDQLQPQHVQLIEKWLLKKSTCLVRYVWEDIGSMFWPRYIRRGECAMGQHSCSWPSGMQCVPSDTSTLIILRWQCKLPKGKGRRRFYRRHIHKEYKGDGKSLNLKCHWVRVPYPVTNECTCTC